MADVYRMIAEEPARGGGNASSPLRSLTADLPRDQALGLRLIALARAAASVHMAEAATGMASAFADEPERPDLARSQAALLLGEVGR